jgi:hypothetical protein
MSNWSKISVEPLEMLLNKYNAPINRRCNWCGAWATHRVSRTSTFSGNAYHDDACETCAAEWQKAKESQEIASSDAAD